MCIESLRTDLQYAKTSAQLDDCMRMAYRANAQGRITDDEMAWLDEEIREKRDRKPTQLPSERRTPRPPAKGRRRQDRVVSPSMGRRYRWVASGWLPPQIANQFTPGEQAALSVITLEVREHGSCCLPIEAIAAKAGVGRTTVKNAIREAVRAGLMTKVERPRPGRKSDTNIVKIVSKEWKAWLQNRQGSKPRPPRLLEIFISGSSLPGHQPTFILEAS